MLAFGIALGLALAQAAHDPADCVLDKLTAEQRAGLGEAAAAMVRDGAFPATGPALTQMPGCQAEHRWSLQQANMVARYTIAKAGLPAARQAIVQAGIDPDRVDAAYRALPAEMRLKPLTRDSVDMMFEHLGGLGGKVMTLDNSSFIGRYVGLLNLIDAVPAMIGPGN